mgnify:FL=1
MDNIFAVNLKNLRIEKGLNQTELAEKLFINKSMFSSYEKGTRMPSLDILMQLTFIFNVSIDYMLGVQRNEVKDKQKNLDISGLNDNQIKIIKNLIDEFRNCNK